MKKQKWLVLKDDNNWNIIIPDFDILPHSTDKKSRKRNLAYLDCPCKPEIDYLNQQIIHNSFEQIEKLKELDKTFN